MTSRIVNFNLICVFCFRLIDNLPVATKVINVDTSERTIEQGYRLGFMSKGKAYINNHLKLLLKYHKHSQLVLLSAHCVKFLLL